jgi:hypothetical protein
MDAREKAPIGFRAQPPMYRLAGALYAQPVADASGHRIDEDAASPTGRYERELSTSCAISTKFTLGFTP